MEYLKAGYLLVIALIVSDVTTNPVRNDALVYRDAVVNGRSNNELITPPKLPVIAHLENDPSTLLPNEARTRSGNPRTSGGVNPRFGFTHGFGVSPNSNGGFTGSFSNGVSGLGGGSASAAHSFSVGFNKGFQVSQSASQSSSFNQAHHGSSPFTGGQSSSQSSSFGSSYHGISSSSSAASAASLAGAGLSASSANSQSASNSFGHRPSSSSGHSSSFGASFGGNQLAGSQSGTSVFGSGTASANGAGFGFQTNGLSASGAGAQSSSGVTGFNDIYSNNGEGLLDIRHRGPGTRIRTDTIVFPGESSRYRSESYRRSSTGIQPGRGGRPRNVDDWLAILVSD